MNLQQLRYLVATADEGTMTRAAETLHVAQPALSRAVRSLESELHVTVFERKGRGIRVTPQGREVVAIARRVLAEADRLMALAANQVLRVCSVSGQAREIGSPAIARFVTEGQGRAALDVVDTGEEVVERVRDGQAALGIVDLPAPTGLEAEPLGWQEMLLIHPAGWDLPDPIDAEGLGKVPLLSLGPEDWRHAALRDNLRAVGVEPTIAAETSERDILTGLVQEGAGAWFSYGRQAQAAVDGGAGVVHLDPPVVREIGIVHLGALSPAGRAFVEIARAETESTLLRADDPLLENATWVKGGEVLAAHPPTPTPEGRPGARAGGR